MARRTMARRTECEGECSVLRAVAVAVGVAAQPLSERKPTLQKAPLNTTHLYKGSNASVNIRLQMLQSTSDYK
eukprot:2680865-Rhodomonas_salina.1